MAALLASDIRGLTGMKKVANPSLVRDKFLASDPAIATTNESVSVRELWRALNQSSQAMETEKLVSLVGVFFLKPSLDRFENGVDCLN